MAGAEGHRTASPSPSSMASSSSPSPSNTLHGAVLKKKMRRFSLIERWDTRSVVVDDKGVLSYVKQGKGGKGKEHRSISLDGCTISSLHHLDKPGMCAFEIHHPLWKKGLCLAADDASQREDWVRILQGLATKQSRGNGSANSVRASLPAKGVRSIIPPHLRERAVQAEEIVQSMVLKTYGWTCYSDKKGVKGFRASTTNGYNLSKGVGIIPYHPVSILLAIIDVLEYPTVDPDLDYATRLDLHNSHTFVDRLLFKGVWPIVAARELYVGNTWQVLPNGDIHLNSYSVSDSLYPEEKGIVRAYCPAGGWYIHPLDPECTRCEVTFYGMVDLKGNLVKLVPKGIIDRVNENQAQQVDAKKALLDKDVSKGTGFYHVGIKGPATNEMVAAYIHRLHRRTVPTWRSYDWLQTDDYYTSTTTATTTTTATIPQGLHPSAAAAATAAAAAAAATTTASVKRGEGEKSTTIIITASTLLMIVLMAILGGLIPKLTS